MGATDTKAKAKFELIQGAATSYTDLMAQHLKPLLLYRRSIARGILSDPNNQDMIDTYYDIEKKILNILGILKNE